MRWAWAKILTLIGAGIAAVFAAGSAQGPAFVQAYLQRLGGHIDEARRTVFELREGAMSRAVPDDTARDRLLEAFTARLADLEASRDAIISAHPLWRPMIMAQQSDRDIAAATAQAFTPAMPLDPTSLIYAAIGLVIGWAFWELVQWPVRARLRKRRQRRLLAR
jgi:hypothetical protein